MVAALQKQVSRDFAKAWGIDANLSFVPKGHKPDAGNWWLVILDHAQNAQHLGFHQMTNEGLPVGKVFAATDIEQGKQWSVTASHELLEMLANPDSHLTCFIQNSQTAGVLYAHEVCDPCESDHFAYEIDKVAVSDFVFPAWFETFRKPRSTQFDQTGWVKQPLEILRGGYIDIFDTTSKSGWTMKVFDETHQPKPGDGSRRERRRMGREQWAPRTPRFQREHSH